jgi:hypothetical protein
MSGIPASLMLAAKGAGEPKDNINAAGWRARTRSSRCGFLAMDQVMKPQPTRALPAAANSLFSQSSSP